MFDIPCVIFAGGKSSRMGEDKALLPFGDSKTLTQFQLQKLQKLFKNVYISCKDKNKFDFEASFIEDIPTDNIFAPTTGFVTIFKKLACEKFFVISVDTPFISKDIIKKIISKDNPHAKATIAKTKKGIQPMCGIYHNTLEKDFKNMLKEDNHKLGFLLKNSDANYVMFDDEKPFMNLNNPKEYQEALTLV
jgi:molybdopterin-guanine dinucleotide biosynthesis protein A